MTGTTEEEVKASNREYRDRPMSIDRRDRVLDMLGQIRGPIGTYPLDLLI
jgi:hypothetical protein